MRENKVFPVKSSHCTEGNAYIWCLHTNSEDNEIQKAFYCLSLLLSQKPFDRYGIGKDTFYLRTRINVFSIEKLPIREPIQRSSTTILIGWRQRQNLNFFQYLEVQRQASDTIPKSPNCLKYACVITKGNVFVFFAIGLEPPLCHNNYPLGEVLHDTSFDF